MSSITKMTLKTFVLKPLSFVWESLYRLRRSFYEYGVLKKSYFKVPIISVGNLTFGGTGKTPVIIWLIEWLEAQNLVPLVLTRGYKGELENSSGIIKGGQRFQSNPKLFGDEPLLISRKMNKGAVVIGKKRSDNLKKYFDEILPDVVLLDDGFQHIQLYRSFNIVLFDALMPQESYQTAPLGYLREGLTALKDADAILLSRTDQVKDEDLEGLLKYIKPFHRSDIPIARLFYKVDAIKDCYDRVTMKVEDLNGKNVIALTGLASPESFYKMLESFDAHIVEKAQYPDHHFFSAEDINELLIKCVQDNAVIICSEKDMVKIKRVSQSSKINYLSIAIAFSGGEDQLVERIKQVIKPL